MRIAIVTLTTTARRTGVAEYVINLIEGLQQVDKENEYYIFTAIDNRYMFNIHSQNFHEVPLSLTHSKYARPIFYFWLLFVLPLWVRKRKIDLVHLPNTLFVSGWFKTVTTIHDITELKVRKYPRLRTFFRFLMIKSALRNSKKIITVSQSSKKDLENMGAKNVRAIHLGFSNPFKINPPIDLQEQILKKYNLLGKTYALAIGTILKHKNYGILVESFSLALKETENIHLVIVGAPDNDYENILQLIYRNNIKNNVHILNFIDSTDKLILLKNASIFCFISSYEGFGIPILEAQAAGVPVIANNVSSLPEIGGAGVYLVDKVRLSTSTKSAIVSLLEDKELRKKYIENGYVNLNRFSWNQFAKETLSVYSEFKL